MSKSDKIDLEDYKWKNRLIFIFAPSRNHPGYQAQKTETEGKIPEIIDRDLVVFEILEDGQSKVGDDILGTEAITFLREKFNVEPGKYTVILVGKDGGEKLRGDENVPLADIFSLIDTMPMRQQEMKEKEKRQN
ncbi:DUF4174 domain-containing protein [bacterium]|nr:DUF4174 domain-containing protein [bacterium]